jgi:transcriptional regulator
MYAPPHVAESDPVVLRDAARTIGVGHLVTLGADGLDASFVPLVIDDEAAVVTGHLARANRQWCRADTTVEALLTWVGPDAYISPNYYPSTRVHGKVVPTWNFLTVQARGTLVVHEDNDWKRAQVTELTVVHESSLPEPWSVDDAPADYIDARLGAIVGFEVRLTSIVGKWKLSQDRSDADVAGVIAALRAFGPGTNEAGVGGLLSEARSDPPIRPR